MPLRTGGKITLAATFLAVALVGGAALFQLKAADLAASERDHLLHLIARTQTEMATSQLNDASARASTIARALLKASSDKELGASPQALGRAVKYWMGATPSLLEVSAHEHPAGPLRWERDALDTPVQTSPQVQVQDTSAPPLRPPLEAPRVTITEKRLTTLADGSERRPLLEVRALVEPNSTTTPAESWLLHLQIDLSPALRALTRGPGHRFGHLALLTAEEDFAWGPTQRYDDGGSGWVELSDADLIEACRAWKSKGAAADRFTPFHRGGHVFAVQGRTLNTFLPDPATICIVLPRSDYTGLF